MATPIGNAGDMTLRAIEVLRAADALAAEDTRRTRALMDLHGIALGDRPLVSYHDRNGPARRPRIMAWLAAGRSVAYCSDAGTPLLADPGYRLAEAAIAAGHPVIPLPGASALLAGLVVSGLPTDRFLFAGFLPAKQGQRRSALAELAAIPATLVFYESPRRLAASLADMAEILGPDRPAAVARELTKRFEETRRAPLATLARQYADAPEPRGEIVVMVGAGTPPEAAAESVEAALREALRTMSLKDAARDVARRFGLARTDVYRRGLALED